jgi:hypothetical protein
MKRSTVEARCCVVIATDERSERLTNGLHQRPLNCQQAAVVKRGFLGQASVRARRVVSPAWAVTKMRRRRSTSAGL